MSRLVILAALLAGCALHHEPAATDAGADAGCVTDCCLGLTHDDAGEPPAIEWVPAERYCERLDARGCTGECPDTLCDRARADACLEAVEASDESCPDVLTQPICTGMCR